MMKRFSLVCLILVAAPAAATSNLYPTQPLQVRGDVPVRCRVLQPSSDGGLNTTFAADANGGTLTLTSLVDANSARTLTLRAAIAFPISCIGAHTLTVTSQGGGLSNGGAAGPSDGFASHVNYAMTANWAGTTQSVVTQGSAVTLDLSQSGPQGGTLNITFDIAAGQGPLINGTYTDQLVIQVNAQ